MGLRLLSLPDLTRYRRLLPTEEDLQSEWGAAVSHPGKYVSLLVGQLDDDEIRAELDEENHYNKEPHARVMKNYFLAYHQLWRTRVGLRRGPKKRRASGGSR